MSQASGSPFTNSPFSVYNDNFGHVGPFGPQGPQGAIGAVGPVGPPGVVVDIEAASCVGLQLYQPVKDINVIYPLNDAPLANLLAGTGSLDTSAISGIVYTADIAGWYKITMLMTLQNLPVSGAQTTDCQVIFNYVPLVGAPVSVFKNYDAINYGFSPPYMQDSTYNYSITWYLNNGDKVGFEYDQITNQLQYQLINQYQFTCNRISL